jgi:hypothetical protein
MRRSERGPLDMESSPPDQDFNVALVVKLPKCLKQSVGKRAGTRDSIQSGPQADLPIHGPAPDG